MCGRDFDLLRIRGRVLDTLGCNTDVVLSVDHAKQELAAAESKPSLVLICHTAGDEAAAQVRSLALVAGVPTYYVERLIPPQQLVSDIRNLLEQEQRVRKAAGRPCG